MACYLGGEAKPADHNARWHERVRDPASVEAPLNPRWQRSLTVAADHGRR
ncbi:hypothetical protein AB0I84_16815 [Streptomyces spectabilis]